MAIRPISLLMAAGKRIGKASLNEIAGWMWILASLLHKQLIDLFHHFKPMKLISTTLRALPAIVLIALSFQEIRAEPSPKVELVAPGIWRIRLGKPEKFTPTFFRAAPVDRESFKGCQELKKCQ